MPENLKNGTGSLKVTVIRFVIGTLGTISKSLEKGIGRYRNKRTSGYHPEYNSIKIGENTEKSPRYLKRLVVTHTGKLSANTGAKTLKGVK